MNPGLIVKLRPSTPWRMGPASGQRDQVDLILHSDTLFSAVTHAMRLLGRMEAWLDATAREATPAVVFSSLFPFTGDVRYFVPPRTAWPPPPSAKVRWKGARFVPQGVVEAMLQGKALNEDRWSVDGESECLVASGRVAPFRIALRSAAAVDRVTEAAALPHQHACLEFSPGSGLWCAAAFASPAARDEWNEPVRAAFRLLADSGFGGERSRGWGRSEAPEFREGTLPNLLLSTPAPVNGDASQFWLLSLFSPRPEEPVDWGRGSYHVTPRTGRVESPAGSGARKKSIDMVSEGSVLISASAPVGRASDVAPEGHPHPVFQAGFALSIRIAPPRPRAAAPEPVSAEESPEPEFPETPEIEPPETAAVPPNVPEVQPAEVPREEPPTEEPPFTEPEPEPEPSPEAPVPEAPEP